jgi:hypothetical protein
VFSALVDWCIPRQMFFLLVLLPVLCKKTKTDAKREVEQKAYE